jgi:isopentenyl diphosphate isomerase/L-lactate dehydrogenase-like FMN-dependent dehydrogenase
MAAIATLEDVRRVARRRLPRLAFDFIEGGAGSEVTVRRNTTAFDRLTLRPRHLVDVRERSQRTRVLGTEIATPVMIAPTGMARIAGAGGDIEGARAAARAGTVFTLSTMSSDSIEEVARNGSGPLWFQLYLWPQSEITENLLRRARSAGFQTLMVTVDVAIVARRGRDVRNGLVMPPRLRAGSAVDVLRHPRWLRAMYPPLRFGNLAGAGVTTPGRSVAMARLAASLLSNPGASWDGLRRLRENWQGPLVVKGTLTAEDARLALDCGVDGIVVSNHGGRQLDGVAAAIDALPEVVAAVGDRAEVFLDSGVRRGSDVAKALALGARACFVGRPWLYGLAMAGERGVTQVLDLLRDELDETLALCGRPGIDQLDESLLGRA